MRQLQVTGEHGIDSLALVEVPRPDPGPGQVLVKVAAAGLNHRDLTMAALKTPGTPPLPFAPMSDCAGTIAPIGDGVQGVAIGDPVTSLFFQRWLDGPVTADVRWATVPSN